MYINHFIIKGFRSKLNALHCVSPFFPCTSETGQMFFLHCLIATFNILKLQFISDQNNGIFLRKSKVFSLTQGKNKKGFTWIILNHFDGIQIQASLIMSCTIGYKKSWSIIIYLKATFSKCISSILPKLKYECLIKTQVKCTFITDFNSFYMQEFIEENIWRIR